MSVPEKENDMPERGVLEVLSDIKASKLSPKDLGTDTRRQCIMHLSAEGVAVAEIARLLRTTERTIYRDKQAIREDQCIEHDPKLVGMMAGRLAAEAETCIQKIRRVTREKDAPHAVRVDGERVVFEILDKLTQRLQSLGLLPSSSLRVEGDLTHHVGEMSLADIGAEATRLSTVAQLSVKQDTQLIEPERVALRESVGSVPEVSVLPPASPSDRPRMRRKG